MGFWVGESKRARVCLEERVAMMGPMRVGISPRTWQVGTHVLKFANFRWQLPSFLFLFTLYLDHCLGLLIIIADFKSH